MGCRGDFDVTLNANARYTINGCRGMLAHNTSSRLNDCLAKYARSHMNENDSVFIIDGV